MLEEACDILSLTMFENSQMTQEIFSQLNCLEEKQRAIMLKQQQSKQLRDQCNPLVERLFDLQKRKPTIVAKVQGEFAEELPGDETVKEVHYKRREAEKDGFLVTAEHYFLRSHSWTPAAVKTDDGNTKQSSLEIPSFGEAKVSKVKLRRNCSSWEILSPSNESQNGVSGDEDTSDQAYKKRHDKLEKGEKKMKRRDLQRQRDEELKRRAEKRSLKKRGKKTRRQKSPCLSLLPNPELATHIQVEEDLPVSAFGLAVPALPRAEFSLPWLDPTSR